MFYDVVAVIAAILGLLLLFAAINSLFRSGWFLGWLKGTIGFVLTAIALILVLAAWDIYSYKELMADKPLATISFEKLGDRHYRAVMTITSDGSQQSYELKGDQWQLDARILKWQDSLLRMGIKPGYRLGRLAGRYYSLEDERALERTVIDVNPSTAGVDVWDWLNRVDQDIPWLDALYGNATFAPMSDGALYEVSLTFTGLISRPLNESAREASRSWQ